MTAIRALRVDTVVSPAGCQGHGPPLQCSTQFPSDLFVSFYVWIIYGFARAAWKNIELQVL